MQDPFAKLRCPTVCRSKHAVRLVTNTNIAGKTERVWQMARGAGEKGIRSSGEDTAVDSVTVTPHSHICITQTSYLKFLRDILWSFEMKFPSSIC